MPLLAFVFPGQGSQSVGMGRALASASPAAAAVFAAADAALAESISSLAWDGPAEILDRTENAQPALLATSIAYLAALGERWSALGVPALQPAFFAGHSMGQYSAMVAAGVIELGDGVRLVRERGRLMQASGAGREGRMAALIGLDDARLPELIARAGAHGVVGVAQPELPGAGRRVGRAASRGGRSRAGPGAGREAGDRAAGLGGRSLAADGRSRRGDAGRPGRHPVQRSPAPLLANRDARTLITGEAARGELVEHLTAGVDWVRAVEAMTAAGVGTFVEVGPGRVLTGLIKRIAPDAEAVATDAPNAPDGLAVPGIEIPA